jgi:hypothetical protein
VPWHDSADVSSSPSQKPSLSGSVGERGFHRDTTRVAIQTLVFSARLMMFVSALTIESPVITVHKMAPNAAAAAIVPMA